MSDNLTTTTLPYHVEVFKRNFDGIKDSFPALYLAAEQLSDLFDQLFTQRITVLQDQLWQYEAQQMVFGAFASWVQSFILTAAGWGELGLTSLRRSIEFACYISKIKNSNERADLWVCRNDNTDTRKKFSGLFNVPRSFFGADYEHLKYLLVWHDHASDFGAHANFAALATKWRENKNSSAVTMSFQDDPKNVPFTTGTTLMVGSIILDSILTDLKELTKDYDEFIKRVATFKEMLRKARVEAAQYDSGGKVSAQILQWINSGDFSGLDPYYDELKKRYLD